MNKNWKYGILDDAVNKGSSNISLNKIKKEVGDYPVFGAKGFMKNVSFYHQEKEYLGIIKDGAGIGRVSKHPAKSSVLATMQYIIPKVDYEIDFVRYFLESLDFENYRTGSTIPHIYYKDYKSAKFPLVNKEEQKQIVAILDKAFAAIDQAKANIEKNIENAKELFQSKLNAIFSQKGEGWEEKTLGEVTNVQRGSSPRPKGDPKYFSDKETEFNWITIKDISAHCENNILLRTREWLTEEGSKKSRYVDENEFIIAVSGSTTGKCCLTGIKGFIYDGLAVVKTINNIIEPKYLLHYMMRLYSIINNSKSGAAFPNINTNYLNNLPISFPSLKEQQNLVSEIDVLQSETQKIESIFERILNDLEELKKSILQKAFAGELTSPEGTAYTKDGRTPSDINK